MVAQQTGLEVGEFVWTGGDVHLYANHVEQAKIQLERKPKGLPKLHLKRTPKDIFSFHYEDFEISGYAPDPHIKADVAVYQIQAKKHRNRNVASRLTDY